MESVVHGMSEKFVTGMLSTLKKDPKIAAHPLHADPSVQLLVHIISCTKKLKDLYELQQKKDAAQINKDIVNVNSHLSQQLIQPTLNSFVSSYGKILMDSFTFEPKVSVPVSAHGHLFAAYSLLGKHILNQFPEMVNKKHKTSGKMLLHHCVFKSRPIIAEESAKQILKIEPDAAMTVDAGGALPLHWAVRNSEVTMELLDLLIRANPDGPSVKDSKQGFLPLHFAVAQDHPNIEAVRKLLKVYPEGAATTDNSGAMPLHGCVDRDHPSIAVVKALLAAHPEAIKMQCYDEGYLPVHRAVNRENVDLDIVKLLVSYHPESLSVLSVAHQAPLHRALEYQTTARDSSTPRSTPRDKSLGKATIQYLLSQCPSVVSVQGDADGYLPLHLVLDCGSPDFSTASMILQMYPQACHYLSKEGLLPMHVLLASCVSPPLAFVKDLLDTYPQCLFHSVSDIVPLNGWDMSSDKQGSSSASSAMSDLEAWSGEWQERKWTPLSRAVERGLTDIVGLFKQALSKLSSTGAGTTGVYQSPVVFTDSNGVVHTPPVLAGGGSILSNNSMNNNNSMNKNKQATRGASQLFAGNTGSGRMKNKPVASDTGAVMGGQPMMDNFVRPTGQGAISQGTGTARNINFNPVMKLPPHILRAQLSQSIKMQQSQPGAGAGSFNPSSMNAQTGGGSGNGNGINIGASAVSRLSSPPKGGSRAPPAGPIPSSLRQAAENSAIRYSHQGGGGGGQSARDSQFSFNRPRSLPPDDSVGITIESQGHDSHSSQGMSQTVGGSGSSAMIGNNGGNGKLFSQTIDVSSLHEQPALPPLKSTSTVGGNRRDEMV